jgi:2-iminobutanoate/2-iminopropanoate deaminase
MLIRLITVALIFTFTALPASADADRRFVTGERSPSLAPLPFSEGVLVGDTLYIAGHIGLDSKSDRAADDPSAEAKIVMERVKKTVESAGLTMDDVVSLQVYCTDFALFDAFNAVYRGYFTHGFPARAFLGASALLRGAHFEVLGVAVRRHGAHEISGAHGQAPSRD